MSGEGVEDNFPLRSYFMVLQLLKKKQKKALFYFVLTIVGSVRLTTTGNTDATKNAQVRSHSITKTQVSSKE